MTSRSKPNMAMTPEEIAGFLGTVDNGFIAFIDDDGSLRACAVHLALSEDRVNLLQTDDLPISASACLIADTFPSYDKIKGIMLRGRIVGGSDNRSLIAERASGFDFAKTGQG